MRVRARGEVGLIRRMWVLFRGSKEEGGNEEAGRSGGGRVVEKEEENGGFIGGKERQSVWLCVKNMIPRAGSVCA